MTMQTTDTAYGPAEFQVNADGGLYLRWPQGLTINRVAYPRAEGWQIRPKMGGTPYVQVQMSHPDWRRQPTDAAYAAVRREIERLAPVLVTPHAVARTRVEDAERTTGYAEQDRQKAEEAVACARAALEVARAELAALEGVSA